MFLFSRHNSKCSFKKQQFSKVLSKYLFFYPPLSQALFTVAVLLKHCSNIVVALRNLAVVRMSCFGHNLDLAIKKLVNSPQVWQALACHSLAEHYHHSWKKRLKAETRGVRSSIAAQLMGDVPTYWGSTYTMVT